MINWTILVNLELKKIEYIITRSIFYSVIHSSERRQEDD
jgi:hypothetical protein